MNQTLTIRIPENMRKELLEISKAEKKPLSDHILSKIFKILYEKFKMPQAKVEASTHYLKEFCEYSHHEKLEEEFVVTRMMTKFSLLPKAQHRIT
jgi:hypothetical protein